LQNENFSATIVNQIMYKELEIIRTDEVSDLSQGILLNWKKQRKITKKPSDDSMAPCSNWNFRQLKTKHMR